MKKFINKINEKATAIAIKAQTTLDNIKGEGSRQEMVTLFSDGRNMITPTIPRIMQEALTVQMLPWCFMPYGK